MQVSVNVVSDLTTDFIKDVVIPSAVQTFKDHVQLGDFPSEKAGIKWLNDELKKDVSEQITKNFRIVTKADLPVYELQTRRSKTVATLNTGYVVQISQKNRNWSYVIYTDHESGEHIEGWVFTTCLKQIK